MENDSIKWLIAGLAGALFTVLLFAGIGIAIFFRLEKNAPEEPMTALLSDSEEAAREAAEEAEEAEEEAEAAAESAAWAERLGLNKIYKTVYLIPGTYHELYHNKNFKLVEEQLAAGLANTATPFDRYRYSTMVDDLTFVYEDNLPALIKVVDAWAVASPNSHLPLLVRGKLNSELAWEHRGTDYAHEVSRANMNKFEQLSRLAIADLETALQMNPNDPEVSAALASAAAPIEGLDSLRRYYDQTLALNPHHLGVRDTMSTYLLPQWYGSWTKFDRYMEEVDEASKEFPLLFTVRRDNAGFLEVRGKVYEGLWDSDETYRQAAAAFKAQLEQNPTEPTLMASAAFFSVMTGDLENAVKYFERIGSKYPVTDEFESLYSYHWWRVYAMVEYSDDPGVIGTPREKELLDAARTLEPDHFMANGFYLAYLARTKDDAQTKAYWDSLDGGFFKTGELGSPPDYGRLRAMALAARSQIYGVQGTDEEQPLLEEALALAPDNANVRLAYAEYFSERDQYDEARSHLERALELNPAYLPALHTLGWLNYHQKRWDEGIAAANQFLASGDSRYVKMNAYDAKEIIELCEKKKAKAAQETDSGK